MQPGVEGKGPYQGYQGSEQWVTNSNVRAAASADRFFPAGDQTTAERSMASLSKSANQPALQEEFLAGWLLRFPVAHLTPYAGIHAVPRQAEF